MWILQHRRLLAVAAFVFTVSSSVFAHAQDSANRGRKYTPPPATAHVSVAVVKDANGKPIENAAVVFHMVGEEGKGNMELKTNQEGKAVIDVIPIGDSVTLQVIASGFQTFGEDYKIDSDSKDIVVRLKRPAPQYSTYNHSGTQATSTTPQGSAGSAPNSSNTQPAPKQ
jgi:hypothetical protein